jgi:hypothetical protein
MGAESKRCHHCGTAIRYVATVRVEGGALQEWGTICAGITTFERDVYIDREHRRQEWAEVLQERPEVGALLEAVRERDAWVQEVTAAGMVAPRLSYETYRAVDSLQRFKADSFALEEDSWTFCEWLSEVRERPAPSRPSRHIGNVGEVLCVSGTVERMRTLEPYCYGATPATLIVLRTHEGGDLVVTKTSAKWRAGVQEGQQIVLTGTIKRHTEYGNELQTEITRCKIS